MGWDRKRRGASCGYFYQSVRTPDGVKKVYLGRRELAHETSAQIDARKRAKAAELAAVAAEQATHAEPDRLADDLHGWAGELAAAWLVVTGHRKHRGQWRRAKMGTSRARVGSAEWDREGEADPRYVREVVASLARRAEAGDRGAADDLFVWLAKHPDLRPTVRGLEELPARAEAAWVGRVCGEDQLARKVVAGEVAAMRADLLGPAPSVLEKVLASAVVVGHLAYQQTARVAAADAPSAGVQAAWERRLAGAQRRLADAARAFQAVAGRRARGVRPKGSIALFEPGPAATPG